MRDVVLFSSGPDSYFTRHWLLSQKRTPTLVYFDLGHRYRDAELQALKKLGLTKQTQVMQLRDLGSWEKDNGYIWHRNAFLILTAAQVLGAEAGTIWLTTQKDEMQVQDRTPEFMLRMSTLLTTLGQDIRVQTPWMDKDKTDMVAWFLQNGGTIKELRRTWSCYHPAFVRGEHVHCGNCPACIRRYIAFKLNGVEDTWVDDPCTSPTGAAYIKKALEGCYSDERNQRILEGLNGPALPTKSARR